MDFTINLATLLALNIGIVEVVKRTLSLESRYVPSLALFVGVGLSLFWFGVDKVSALTGVFLGLSSIGLFSGTRNTIEG